MASSGKSEWKETIYNKEGKQQNEFPLLVFGKTVKQKMEGRTLFRRYHLIK